MARAAEAGHYAGQAAGSGDGGALGERGAAHLMELVLDLSVSSDPAGELFARGGAEWEAGDEVEPLDCDLFAGQVLAPAHDAPDLAGAGVVEIPEGDRLEVPDLKPPQACGAVFVVQADVAPRQFPQLLEQTGVVAFYDGDVVGAVFAQPVRFSQRSSPPYVVEDEGGPSDGSDAAGADRHRLQSTPALFELGHGVLAGRGDAAQQPFVGAGARCQEGGDVGVRAEGCVHADAGTGVTDIVQGRRAAAYSADRAWRRGSPYPRGMPMHGTFNPAPGLRFFPREADARPGYTPAGRVAGPRKVAR